ncbi:MAG TPA: nitrile hydratase accessory protein [Mycobacteriales bacterium]|nr:nitrile hydratase accessory protein [Mycobacteriales bacterium]
MTVTLPELDVDGPAAPPRSNGELVFAEPWEGRAFGLVMTLVDGGVLAYEDFRQALVQRITAWEAAPPAGETWSYYRCWLQALEQVLAERALVTPDDVDARARAFAQRPAGHDHADHGHDHDH